MGYTLLIAAESIEGTGVIVATGGNGGNGKNGRDATQSTNNDAVGGGGGGSPGGNAGHGGIINCIYHTKDAGVTFDVSCGTKGTDGIGGAGMGGGSNGNACVSASKVGADGAVYTYVI
jgi:hypothetical protein